MPSPVRQEATVRQDDERVLLIVNGRCVLNQPWDGALEIGRALIAQGRRAEEIAKAAGVILDHAILVRAGVPIGLAVDPRIREEAEKTAVSDSSLRRYMPGGVKSKSSVGAPSVKRHRPRNNQSSPRKG